MNDGCSLKGTHILTITSMMDGTHFVTNSFEIRRNCMICKYTYKDIEKHFGDHNMYTQ